MYTCASGCFYDKPSACGVFDGMLLCFVLLPRSCFLDGGVAICLTLMMMLMIICHFSRYYLTIIQSGSLFIKNFPFKLIEI